MLLDFFGVEKVELYGVNVVVLAGDILLHYKVLHPYMCVYMYDDVIRQLENRWTRQLKRCLLFTAETLASREKSLFYST
jgi:hypothetical protein